jgi:hypothetical protein
LANLILNGSTSGSVTLSSPSVSGTTTLTLPVQTGTVMVNGPAFSAYASAGQTISSNTITKLAINTENFDTANCFDSTTNYRFTPNVAGYYQINGIVRGYGSTGMTGFQISIYKNGSEFTRGNLLYLTFTANSTQTGVVSDVIYFNGTTDYLELYGLIVGTGTVAFDYGNNAATSKFSGFLARGA